MKFFKNLFKKKQKVQKRSAIFINRETTNHKPLTKQKNLRKIAKRSFKFNAPINLLGKLGVISKYVWIAVFFGIFLLSLYFTFFTEIFFIRKILIFEGTQESTNLQIRKIVEPLRNRNLFLFDKDSLEQNIKERVDNLANLQIRRQIPDTLIVNFASFKNVANISNVIGKLEVKKSFIINENGILVEQDKINTTLPTIAVASDKAFTVGDQILKTADLKYILDSKKYFEDKFKLKVNEVKFLSRAKELRLITETGFEVWIDILVPYQEQIMKLKNAVPKIDIYQPGLQYIDLRIQSAEGQKIIYK